MKRKILGIVIIAIVLVSTAALAQRPETGRKFGNRGDTQMQRNREMNPRIQRTQFFTEEQQEAIKKIRLETAKEMKPLRNKLNEMEAHQKTLTTADKADMKAIYKNIEEIGKEKTEIAKVQAKQHQDVRKLLSEEQLLSFDNSRGQRFEGAIRGPGMNRMSPPERQGRGTFGRTK